MGINRRAYPRIPCFLSTKTSKGEGIIDELSPMGGRLEASFEPVRGESLLLEIDQQGGKPITLEVLVRRTRKCASGYRTLWTFGPDANSPSLAGRLLTAVTGLPGMSRRVPRSGASGRIPHLARSRPF
jgi:hypothetical protein